MLAKYPITFDTDAIFVPDGQKLDIDQFNFHPFYKVFY